MTNRREAMTQTAVLATALAAAGSASAASAAPQPLFDVPRAVVPIVGSTQVFPVHRIYCIGRNYEAHAREMGSDPSREPPFYFQKPADAVQPLQPGVVADHPYPSLTQNYHHEVELVVALAKGGRDIPVEKALDHVYGYTLGLDMTRRDLQRKMGDQKKPWEIGKSFDLSAPIGPIHPVSLVGHLQDGDIWLKVNGQTRQSATLHHMIWSAAEQIAQLSQAFELQAGDLIYAGTPEGVGPVVKGDVIEIHIDRLPNLSIRIV